MDYIYGGLGYGIYRHAKHSHALEGAQSKIQIDT